MHEYDQPFSVEGSLPHELLDPRSYEVITDPELTDLLNQGLDIVGAPVLDRLLQANDPFDGPVTVIEDDRSQKRVEHYSHRQLLQEVPTYIEAADSAGISTEDAGELLVHALGAVNYPHITQSHLLLANLTHALRATGGTGEVLAPGQIEDLKSLITKAGHDDVIEMSLSAFGSGRNAGLTVADSLRLVDDYIDTANYRQLGYKMYQFRDALQALDAAGVDPTLAVEVFDMVRDMHPEYRGETCQDIRYALMFGSAAAQKTPNDMMQDIAARLRAGNDQAVAELLSGQAQSTAEVFAPREQRDRYFREAPGRLESRAMPYRTLRSFTDGMKDIERLTDANSARGDVVSEGHWIYDPQTSMWYSHGGETRYVGPGRVRHTSVGYDVSELSTTPYSVHIHLREYAIGADKYGFVFPTNADYRAVAYMMEQAHGPAQLRSFISHPLGATEFVYPNDPESVRRVAETFEDVRSRFFARYTNEDHIWATASRMGDGPFARMCVAGINTLLPTGFELRYLPRD